MKAKEAKEKQDERMAGEASPRQAWDDIPLESDHGSPKAQNWTFGKVWKWWKVDKPNKRNRFMRTTNDIKIILKNMFNI